MNKGKSKLFFSKGYHSKKAMKNAIGIAEGSLPTRYLGFSLKVYIY